MSISSDPCSRGCFLQSFNLREPGRASPQADKGGAPARAAQPHLSLNETSSLERHEVTPETGVTWGWGASLPAPGGNPLA